MLPVERPSCDMLIARRMGEWGVALGRSKRSVGSVNRYNGDAPLELVTDGGPRLGNSEGRADACPRGESSSSALRLRWPCAEASSVTGFSTEGRLTERGTEGDGRPVEPPGTWSKGGNSTPRCEGADPKRANGPSGTDELAAVLDSYW